MTLNKNNIKKIGDRAIAMKFQFCAEGDCPLWALAALHALGSLPAQLFRDLLQRILDEKDEDAIMEILKDTSLSSREESARAAACVRWVLQSACACACSGARLARDLAVLGVPRAHAAALALAHDERAGRYAERVSANGFAVNKLTDITVSPAPEGCIDAYKLTLHSETAGARRRSELLIDTTQAKDLLGQLKEVYAKMQAMEQE